MLNTFCVMERGQIFVTKFVNDPSNNMRNHEVKNIIFVFHFFFTLFEFDIEVEKCIPYFDIIWKLEVFDFMFLHFFALNAN